MKSDRLYFRTRGGPTQGWGNVFRLASFAHACQAARDTEITFFVEGPHEVVHYLESENFSVTALTDDVRPELEESILRSHGRADVLFVEMLEITPERQSLLRRHCDRLVIFDDLCDHIYDADLVVCGQALPSHANRSLSAPRTRFLTGPKYFLCRPEFLAFADRQRVYAKEPRSILVTLGGGAYDVGYLKCALALRALERTLQITFVLGYGKTQLGRQLLEILPAADILEGVKDLGQRFWDCDIAITSAGYTKFEAGLTQTPFLMLSVQWHQIPLAQSFAAASGVKDLGYMAYVEPRDILRGLKELDCAEARRLRTHRARTVVDGRGFERVRNAVFEQHIIPSQ